MHHIGKYYLGMSISFSNTREATGVLYTIYKHYTIRIRVLKLYKITG